MELVTLIANRALTGNYGHREAGETFTTDNRTAESLEARGLARRFYPPPPVTVSLSLEWASKMRSAPENKMIAPEANKAEPVVKRRRGRPPGSKNTSRG